MGCPDLLLLAGVLLLLTPAQCQEAGEGQADCDLGLYSRENNKWDEWLEAAARAREEQEQDSSREGGCSCYHPVVERDLQPWRGGVARQVVQEASRLGRATRCCPLPLPPTPPPAPGTR